MTRDYRQWHQAYDDPDSGLSWRLRTVQRWIGDTLDATAGPVRVLSLCSGDGRDLLGVLADRADAGRVSATLVELDPELAERARAAGAATGAAVDVRTGDAGTTDAGVGAVPADLVLLVGIFGNISLDDLQTTISLAPQFCAPDATLIWSRGRHDDDHNDAVRAWFTAAGFTEIDYAALDSGTRPALGLVRYAGPGVPLEPGRRLFRFIR